MNRYGMDNEHHREWQHTDKVTESLTALFELTARIEERIKMISEKQSEYDAKIEKFVDSQAKFVERIVGLESKNGDSLREDMGDLHHEYRDFTDEIYEKMHSIELNISNLQKTSTSQEGRWQYVFDVIVKIGVVIASAIIVYKLGFQPI